MNIVIRRAAEISIAACCLLAPSSQALASDEGDAVKESQQLIANFKQTDPGLDRFIKSSAGYVVFPSVGKGGLIVGGAHGTGVLFENGKSIGRAALNQVTVGAQVGGQSYSEIIFFETPVVLNDFKRGNFEFAAQVSAV
ncbi:MAG: lipid-binding SYLF domain-containing protein, partial [Polyangiaceae bacterium]